MFKHYKSAPSSSSDFNQNNWEVESSFCEDASAPIVPPMILQQNPETEIVGHAVTSHPQPSEWLYDYPQSSLIEGVTVTIAPQMILQQNADTGMMGHHVVTNCVHKHQNGFSITFKVVIVNFLVPHMHLK